MPGLDPGINVVHPTERRGVDGRVMPGHDRRMKRNDRGEQVVTPQSMRSRLLRLVILWLAGADLRLTILAVPPLLPLIHHDLALNEKVVGALAGLPVLLLGVAAIPGSLVIASIRARRAAIAGLLFVAAVAAARGIGDSAAMLFGMTVLMGGGIAVLQPVLPTLVAEWFADMPGFATAIYANGFLIGEAVPAAVMLPLVLPAVGGSWPAALAVWSLPLAITALMILGVAPARHATAMSRGGVAPTRWWPDWRSAATWRLGLLVGGTGGLYFSTNAFIPDYLHATGRPGLVTLALAALNAGQLPASFLLLYAIRRMGRARASYLVPPLVALPALCGLFAPADWAIVVGAATIGFCCGIVLILSLALPPQLAPPDDVHRLAAGMFAIGYTLSCAIPPLGGALWDATGIPETALVASAASAAIVAAAALTLGPRSLPRAVAAT
jgi:MFS transporter, CP family, cyanate transporter